MKKLALALAVSTIVTGATSANISTGFYLGAHAGYGSTTSKLNGFAAGGGLNTGTLQMGNNQGNIGVHGGYGWVTGCLYLGGEVSYTFENAKVTDSLGTGGAFGVNQLKRNGYFRAALRGGYLFTPSTMGYIALGGNWGKWTVNDQLDFAASANPSTASKNTVSFAPAVGVETAVHKNVYLRLEYSYEFGPSVRANNRTITTDSTNWGSIRSQSGKVGLSYKF